MFKRRKEKQVLGANSILDINGIEEQKDPQKEVDLEKKWESFFSSIKTKAQQKAYQIEGDFSFEEREQMVEDFMEAFRRIYVEITIHHQIEAIRKGVKFAVKLAIKNKKNIILIQGNSESDKLFVEAASREINKHVVKKDVDVQIISRGDLLSGDFPSSENQVVLIVDDVSYSGYQKKGLLEDVDNYLNPSRIVLSFGGCSNYAIKNIQELKLKINIFFQKEIPELASELEKLKDKRVLNLARKIFPEFARHDGYSLVPGLVGAFSTFKSPDKLSISLGIRPPFFGKKSRSFYPGAI